VSRLIRTSLVSALVALVVASITPQPAHAATVGTILNGVVTNVTKPVGHLLDQEIGGSLFGDDREVHGRSALDDPGSLYNTDRLIDADRLWKQGVTGRGVDVAVLDSGVTPVAGLDAPGKVLYGPDLSFDSQSPNLRYLDGYGHGTHMAGIIAARDAGITRPELASSDTAVGVAPDARIVSVKVAAADGSTDVSQVIAGIDWVVQHRNDNGTNIRVLNLSFGTDGSQSYLTDPLTYAVENAWRHGIVVVVAAGNDGPTAPLNDPAYDPFVIAVGASDHHATLGKGDDTVADFSSRGTAARRPDLAAPGRSITSLRDPGSYIDEMHPDAVVKDRFFRGSGSSQATAVTSGAVALLLQARPQLTPDQVKQLLVEGAAPLSNSGLAADRGIGRLNVATSASMLPLLATQAARPGTGLGSLDAARGTSIELYDDDVLLQGEVDVMGRTWNAAQWAASTKAGNAWTGGWWNGSEWTGDAYTVTGWAAAGWTGRAWSGRTWTGRSWSGRTWTGRSWSGATWTGRTWTGRTWTGRSWS
jgi:serine protease AprX